MNNRETETYEVVSSLRDVTIQPDGTLTVATVKKFYQDGEERFSDVVYETFDQGGVPYPSEVQELIARVAPRS